MPNFTVSDEAMDALAAAPELDRVKFLDSLDDNQRSQIAAFAPEWKKRRALKPVAAALPQPVAAPAQPAQLPSAPMAAPAPVQAAAPAPPVAPWQGPVQPPKPSFGSRMQQQAEEELNAEMGGEISYDAMGRITTGPTADARNNEFAFLNPADKGVNKLVSATGASPATETVIRAGGSALVGDRLMERMEPGRRLQGQNQLEDSLGSVGTTAVLVGSQAIGNLITNLVPLTSGGKGAKAATAAGQTLKSTMKEAMVKGGVEGGYWAVPQGQEPAIGAGAGMALAPVAAAAGYGAKKYAVNKAAKKAEAVAAKTLKGPEAEKFWADASILVDEMRVRNEVGTDPAAAVPTLANITDPEFKPSYSVVKRGPEGTFGHIVSLNADGTRSRAVMPIASVEDAQKFAAYNKKHKIEFNVGDAGRDIPDSIFIALAEGREAEMKVGKEYTLGDGRKVVVKQSHLDLTPAEVPSAKNAPDVDAPPIPEPKKNVVISVDSDGHVKAGTKNVVVPEKPLFEGKPLGPEAKTGGAPRNRARPPPAPPEDVDDIDILPDGPPPPSFKGPKKEVTAVRGYIQTEQGSQTVDMIGKSSDHWELALQNGQSIEPGMVLVLGDGDKVLSVPEAQFHPAKDVPEALALSPKMVSEPHPALAKSHPQALEDMQGLQDAFGAVVKRNPGLAEKLFIKSGLVSPHHMGPQDLAEKMRLKNGSEALRASQEELANRLAKVMGGRKNSVLAQIDKDLSKVADGKMSLADLQAKNPKLAKELETTVRPMLEELDDLIAQASDLGIVTKGLDKDKAVRFFANAYLNYLLPKDKWAKLVPSEAMGDLVDGLVGALNAKGKKWTPTQIQSVVDRILLADDATAAYRASGLAKDLGQDVPPELRKVLGEVDSGMLKISRAIGNLRAKVAEHRLFAEIAANPAQYSHGKQPHLHPDPIPNNVEMYGPLAGGYVSPDLRDTVVMLPKAQVIGHRWVQSIMSSRKANMITRPSTWMRSMFGNWLYSALAGGLDPFRPKESGKAFIKGLQAYRDYRKDPTGKTGLGHWLKTAKAFGADWAGMAETEIGKDKKFQDALLSRLADEQDLDIFSMTEKLRDGFFKIYKKPGEVAGSALDVQDRIFRLSNFIALVEKYKSNPAKYLGNVPADQVDQAAAHLASKRINDSFMNAAHVGAKIDQARKSGAGIVATWLTSATEEARIWGMMTQRIMSGQEKDLTARLGAFSLMGTLGWAGMHYWRKRFADPEQSNEAVAAARANMTDRSKIYKKFSVASPWVDDQGRLEFYDPTKYILPLQLMTGHEDDALLANAFTNASLYAIDGEASGSAGRKLFESAGVVRPVDFTPIHTEGQTGVGKLLGTAADMGFVPGVGKDMYEAGRRAGAWGMKGRHTETMSPRQAAQNFVGISTTPARPESPAGQLESKYELNKLKSQRKSVAKYMAQNGMSAADIAKAIAGIDDRISVLTNKMAARQEANAAYEKVKNK